MIVTVIKGIFLVYGGTEAVGLVHGMIKHREKGVTPFQYAVYYLVGFIANFLTSWELAVWRRRLLPTN